ncbi:hypothetical protein NN561_019440 [Cricetulus griseus]
MAGCGRRVRFRPEPPRGGLHTAGGGRSRETLAGLRSCGGGAFKGRWRRRADWQPADDGTDRKDSVFGSAPPPGSSGRRAVIGTAEHTRKPVGWQRGGDSCAGRPALPGSGRGRS